MLLLRPEAVKGDRCHLPLVLPQRVIESGRQFVKEGMEVRFHERLGATDGGALLGSAPTLWPDSLLVLRLVDPIYLRSPEAKVTVAERISGLINLRPHPGVAPVLDLAQSSTDGCFIVREYKRGWSLGSLLAKLSSSGRVLPPAAALPWIIDVAEAVAWLHQCRGVDQQPVSHCNLHPGNLIITPEGRIALTDLCLLGERSPDRWWYLPAEAFRGASGTRDWDVFSLGALCYRLLTGKTPAELNDSTVPEGGPAPLKVYWHQAPSLLNEEVELALAQSSGRARATIERLTDALREALEVVGGPMTPAVRANWVAEALGEVRHAAPSDRSIHLVSMLAETLDNAPPISLEDLPPATAAVAAPPLEPPVAPVDPASLFDDEEESTAIDQADDLEVAKTELQPAVSEEMLADDTLLHAIPDLVSVEPDTLNGEEDDPTPASIPVPSAPGPSVASAELEMAAVPADLALVAGLEEVRDDLSDPNLEAFDSDWEAATSLDSMPSLGVVHGTPPANTPVPLENDLAQTIRADELQVSGETPPIELTVRSRNQGSVAPEEVGPTGNEHTPPAVSTGVSMDGILTEDPDALLRASTEPEALAVSQTEELDQTPPAQEPSPGQPPGPLRPTDIPAPTVPPEEGPEDLPYRRFSESQEFARLGEQASYIRKYGVEDNNNLSEETCARERLIGLTRENEIITSSPSRKVVWVLVILLGTAMAVAAVWLLIDTLGR